MDALNKRLNAVSAEKKRPVPGFGDKGCPTQTEARVIGFLLPATRANPRSAFRCSSGHCSAAAREVNAVFAETSTYRYVTGRRGNRRIDLDYESSASSG
jgi:hypothetical protein